MKPPVLILGSEPRVVVAIARSLAGHGVPASVASLSAEGPRIWSRDIQEFIVLPEYYSDPQGCTAALLDLIRSRGFDMLIPSNDTALNLVSSHYQELAAKVRLACPPPEIVDRVLHKDRTLAVAEQCGIAIPAAFEVSDPKELEALGSRLRFPLVAKPKSKTDLASSTFKVRYFTGLEELRAAFAEQLDFGAQNFLQEYCPGHGVGLGILLHEGSALAVFQHRRLKESPPSGGVSVLAVSESPDADLTDAAVKLLRSLEWEGVAMVEFRRDPATGRAVLMEVNGRYWGTLSLAVQAGVDFPRYEWDLAHGQTPQVAATYSTGTRWRWMIGDLMRLTYVLRQPESGLLSRQGWIEMARFTADCVRPSRPALWSLRDPVPALSELLETLTAGLRKGAGILASKVVPQAMKQALRDYRNLAPRYRAAYRRVRLLRAMGLRRDQSRLPGELQSVLFVCYGNIIRSPMAAALLRARLAGSGMEAMQVTSAGLAGRPGHGADPRAVKVAKEFGITLDGHRSQALTTELVSGSDAIFVMDGFNESMLLTSYPWASSKVFLLGGFANQPGASPEIADPYLGTTGDVRRCYDTVLAAVEGLASALQAPRGTALVATHPAAGPRDVVGSNSR